MSGASGYFSGYSRKSIESKKMSGLRGRNQNQQKLNLLKFRSKKISYALR
jgi:hypothetical protein